MNQEEVEAAEVSRPDGVPSCRKGFRRVVDTDGNNVVVDLGFLVFGCGHVGHLVLILLAAQ
jgi:hypothetical protein